MRKQDFIDALENAGWRSVHDAQHEQIDDLHRKIFPVVAELECEVEELVHDINEYINAPQPPI